MRERIKTNSLRLVGRWSSSFVAVSMRVFGAWDFLVEGWINLAGLLFLMWAMSSHFIPNQFSDSSMKKTFSTFDKKEEDSGGSQQDTGLLLLRPVSKASNFWQGQLKLKHSKVKFGRHILIFYMFGNTDKLFFFLPKNLPSTKGLIQSILNNRRIDILGWKRRSSFFFSSLFQGQPLIVLSLIGVWFVSNYNSWSSLSSGWGLVWSFMIWDRDTKLSSPRSRRVTDSRNDL